MILPGPRNSLTDIAGLQVGNAHDIAAWSGVTVVLPDRPVLAAVDVRGGSPFTVNTATLDPSSIVKALHGLVLSGGSAFGLEAAGGLTSWLAVRGRGASIGGRSIPTVAGAILYDLANGGDKAWGEMPPYRALARRRPSGRPRFRAGQCRCRLRRHRRPDQGWAGHGLRRRSHHRGHRRRARRVNPVGSVTMPGGSTMWAWHLEQAGELGGQIPPTIATGPPARDQGRHRRQHHHRRDRHRRGPRPGPAARLAVMAQDGYAYAIRPIHTHLDGDVVFALTTAEAPLPQAADTLVRLGAIAADVMARAVCRGVYAAEDLGDYRSYRSLLAPPGPAPAMVG